MACILETPSRFDFSLYVVRRPQNGLDFLQSMYLTRYRSSRFVESFTVRLPFNQLLCNRQCCSPKVYDLIHWIMELFTQMTELVTQMTPSHALPFKVLVGMI